MNSLVSLVRAGLQKQAAAGGLPQRSVHTRAFDPKGTTKGVYPPQSVAKRFCPRALEKGVLPRSVLPQKSSQRDSGNHQKKNIYKILVLIHCKNSSRRNNGSIETYRQLFS
jgi:hypothetical protein